MTFLGPWTHFSYSSAFTLESLISIYLSVRVCVRPSVRRSLSIRGSRCTAVPQSLLQTVRPYRLAVSTQLHPLPVLPAYLALSPLVLSPSLSLSLSLSLACARNARGRQRRETEKLNALHRAIVSFSSQGTSRMTYIDFCNTFLEYMDLFFCAKPAFNAIDGQCAHPARKRRRRQRRSERPKAYLKARHLLPFMNGKNACEILYPLTFRYNIYTAMCYLTLPAMLISWPLVATDIFPRLKSLKSS